MGGFEHDTMSASASDDEADHRSMVTIRLDSCHSVWYFQPVRRRFRRSLKGFGATDVSAGWRPYYGLRFDDAGDHFTVFLNEDGTRRLVSWCHRPGEKGCDNCVDASTGELSLDDLLQPVR